MFKYINQLEIENIQLMTYDNPGWGLKIFLKYMLSVERTIIKRYDFSDNDWFIQIIDNNCLKTAGSNTKLLDIYLSIIEFFKLPLSTMTNDVSKIIVWLQEWYANECDEYWEHLYGVNGEMDSKGNVVITIDLDETIWEEEYFEPQLKCEKIKTKFIIKCYFDELVDNLTIFKEWIESID